MSGLRHNRLKYLPVLCLLALPQLAQAAPVQDISAIKVMDENGVDLIGGTMNFPSLEQSIGTPESGLHLSHQSPVPIGFSNPEPPPADNYSVSLKYRHFPYFNGYQFNHMEVNFGGVINRFTESGGGWFPYKGGKGVLSCTSTSCTYTDTQGSVLEFNGKPGPNQAVGATRLTKPDGEIITFTSGTVSSSLGWMIKKKGIQNTGYHYQGFYRMINSAADYCDPAAASCDTLTVYPEFSPFRDVLGNGWSFSYLGTEPSPKTGGAYGTADVHRAVDPRGVETVWAVNRTYGGGPPANEATDPAWFVNRVWRVTRAGQTWTYKANYIYPSDPMATLLPWREVVIPPGGRMNILEFEGHNSRATLYVNELGWGTTQAYAWYDVSSVTSPSGVAAHYTRDSRGNITSTRVRPKDGASDGSQDLVTTFTFPATCTNVKTCNKPTSVTDARGNTTTYAYDPDHGGVLTETKPVVNGVEAQTRYAYQQFTPYLTTSGGGVAAQPLVWRLVSTSTCQTMTLATCVGTADELKTTLAYDPTSSAYGARNLLPLSKTVSSGNGSLASTVTFTYDRYGNVIVEDGPLPGTDDAVHYFYDLKRQRIGSIGGDPDGSGALPRQAVRTAYGVDGQVESVAKGTVSEPTLAALQAMVPAERVETEYSSVTGLAMVERHYATGANPVAVKQMSYDVRRRLECVAQRMNPAAFGSLPASACTLGTAGTDGPDRITKTVYDPAGHVVQVRQGVGTPLERAYSTFAYARNSKVTDSIDANGNRTKMTYDAFDRLVGLNYPSTTRPSAFNPSTDATALSTAGAHSTTDYEQYGYDNNGNQTSWRRRDGNIIGYAYDSLNRQTAKGGSALADVAITYDLLGNVKSKVFATGGQGVTYTYDGLGRLSSTTDMNGRTVGYAYNAASARISLIHPDLNTVGYGLDNTNRMTSLGWNATSGLLTQSYDSLGRLSGQGKVGGSTSYGYDGIGRLTSMTNDLAGTSNDVTWTFGYNPASQIQSSSATSTVYDYKELSSATVNKTHDGLNRDTGIVAVGGYDARGNLTYEGTGGRTMTYDIENRLLSVVSGSANMRLNYDPEGRLYRYSNDGGSTWTTFLYDGVNLIAEYSGTSTTPLRRYIHGTGTDNPLLWFEGSGTSDRRWLYTNYQGSVISYTGESGTPGAIFKYGPYGEPKDINNNENWSGLRFRYTGQVTLPAAKLYYYKARVYDPNYGRFLQTDPIGSEDDLNLYGYVKGDPVNNADPDGQQTMPSFVTNRYAENQKACGGDVGCTQRINMEQDVAGAGMVLAGVSLLAPDPSDLVVAGVLGKLALGGKAGKVVDDIVGAFCCFTAGTMVATENGLKPIETLKVGDRVLSKSDVTGETAYKAITATIPKHDRVIYRIEFAISLPDGSERVTSFETTEEHPWRANDNQWVETRNLDEGHIIQTAYGQGARVLSVTNTAKLQATYNIEVADFHTYFIGEDRIWVHNCGNGRKARDHFSRSTAEEIRERNREIGGGVEHCESCGTIVTRQNGPNQKGQSIDPTRSELDHIQPVADGGGHGSTNGQVLCHGCHVEKTVRENLLRAGQK